MVSVPGEDSSTAHFRLSAAHLAVPHEFIELEAVRDACRLTGEYPSAGRAQRDLEQRKEQEDEKHLQALQDKHEVESQALARSQQQDYAAFVARWDERDAERSAQARQQQDALVARHANEHDIFRRNAEASMPLPKWSRDLLNKRKIEEHLVRQRQFPQAAQVKASADLQEAEEVRQNEEAYWSKVSLEEAKLLHRQSRDLNALDHRNTFASDEAQVTQRRELDKLTKRFQVARIELSKAQGLERIDLEQAIKGWFNTRKFGLGPSPLIPVSPMGMSLMTPGIRFSLQRNYRSEPALARKGAQPRRGTSLATTGEGESSGSDCIEPSYTVQDSPGDGPSPSGRTACSTPTLPRIPGASSSLPKALQPKARARGVTPLRVTGPKQGLSPGSAGSLSPASGLSNYSPEAGSRGGSPDSPLGGSAAGAAPSGRASAGAASQGSGSKDGDMLQMDD